MSSSESCTTTLLDCTASSFDASLGRAVCSITVAMASVDVGTYPVSVAIPSRHQWAPVRVDVRAPERAIWRACGRQHWSASADVAPAETAIGDGH
jgi:hypothetical protein